MISWRAETITDSSAQIVYVSHIVVLDARFPSLDAAQAAAMQRRVHQIYPTVTLTIGLPRMIASLEHVNVPVRSVAGDTRRRRFSSVRPRRLCSWWTENLY